MTTAETKAFTKEQAVRIIIAAIENKAIDFPFSKGLNTKRVEELIERQKFSTNKHELTLRSFETCAIAYELAGLARRDALYLLTLLEALTTPLTEKETNNISRFMID